MKKSLFVGLIALLVSASLQAQTQEYMIIDKTDGTSIKLGIEEIKQMYFNKEMDPAFGQVAEAVDLGLSVDWASWDVGASKIGGFGGLYGWADPTGKLTTKRLADYPSNNPPKEISGTEYDIAHVVWGDDWRLPTYEEIKELYENCTWYMYYLNGDSCIQVVGPSGNYIVLPFAGCRNGEEIQERQKKGYYWSGTLQSEKNADKKWVHGFYASHDEYGTTGLNRAWGFSVRPVRPRVGNPIATSTVADFYEIRTSWDGNTRYRITGVIQQVYDSANNSFSLKDFSGEVTVNSDFSFSNNGLKVGDIVTIVGTPANVDKNFDNPMSTSGSFGLHGEILESMNSVTEVSIADFLKKSDSKDAYYMVTGTVDEIVNTTYGNLYLKDGANRLYVYGCYPGYGATGDNRKGFLAIEGIEVGDKLTMIGYRDTYNGTVELAGGIFFSHEKQAAQISVSPESVILGSDYGSTASIEITSNVDWTITDIPLWLSLSQTSGTGSEKTVNVTLSAKENYEGVDDRPFETITIINQAFGKSATVGVSQKGVGQIFKVTDIPVSLASNAGAEGTFTIITNLDFTVSSKSDWLEVTPTSGNTTTVVTVRAKSANPGSSERPGRISISNALYGSYAVDVNQAGTETTIIYREPYTVWGATKTQTKNYMNGYTIYKEEDNSIAYRGKDLEALIMYGFSDSKLTVAAVVVPTSKTTLEKLDEQFQKNNYVLKGKAEDGTIMYLSSDNKTVVFVETDTEVEAYYITYADVNSMIPDSDVLFEEPYVNWGASRSTVKSAMQDRGYTLGAESTNASENYYLLYQGKGKEQYSAYLFNSSIKLVQVQMLFLESDASVDDVRSDLSSRLSYSYIGTNSGKTQYWYLAPDGKSYAIVERNSLSSGEKVTVLTYISSETSSSRQSTRESDETVAVFENTVLPPISMNASTLQKLQLEKNWKRVKNCMPIRININNMSN